MNKFSSLIFLAILIFGCEIKVKTSSIKFEEVGSSFLSALYNRRTDVCLRKMDQRFINLTKEQNIDVDSLINLLADKLYDKFKGEISSSLVLSKDTFFQKTQSTYLKYKVSSAVYSGYYNFYVNNTDGKIILITQNEPVE